MSDDAFIDNLRQEMAGRLNKIAIKAMSDYLIAIVSGDITEAERSLKIVRIIEEMKADMMTAPLSQLDGLFKIRMEDIDRL